MHQVTEGRGERGINDNTLSELFSYAHWLISLQNSSYLCFHTDSKTKLQVLDDYRIAVELSETYLSKNQSAVKRRLNPREYGVKGDEKDKEYLERILVSFQEDTGVDFRVMESVLHQLAESSFPKESVNYSEIVPNVIRIKAEDAICDYDKFVIDNVPCEEVEKAYDYLTIDVSKLKSIGGKDYPILPIWEREKRENRLSIKPLIKDDDFYIFSPVIVDMVRSRWTQGWAQFYPPYEIGLNRTVNMLSKWKRHYEHKFSSDVEDLFRSFGFEYCKHDVDIRREDRNGNHPRVDELGDYDVIGFSNT